MIEMTTEKRNGLKKIMEWYWKFGNTEHIISNSDYEFVYNLYNNGLSFYGNEIQERLNEIREKYLQYKDYE